LNLIIKDLSNRQVCSPTVELQTLHKLQKKMERTINTYKVRKLNALETKLAVDKIKILEIRKADFEGNNTTQGIPIFYSGPYAVLDVIKVGYSIDNRLLRKCEVVVAKNND
jgi:molecular chaperone GrpE (heat shock protein)